MAAQMTGSVEKPAETHLGITALTPSSEDSGVRIFLDVTKKEIRQPFRVGCLP
jgi:hypothetical protein